MLRNKNRATKVVTLMSRDKISRKFIKKTVVFLDRFFSRSISATYKRKENKCILFQHFKASESRANLERCLSLQSQYERMLDEYTEFLETAQTKLHSEAVSAMALDHLQQQLKTHKVKLTVPV